VGDVEDRDPLVAGFLPLALLAVGCDSETIDQEALGLWDDGACDAVRPPLVFGLMTVQSLVASLGERASALESSAKAFNAVDSLDPDATAPDGLEDNLVELAETNFAEVLCGSPFGAPEPC